MKLLYLRIAVVLAIVTALVFVSFSGISFRVSSAASSTDFANANSAISNAYALVYHSQVQDHGDVSNLVAQLNSATQLVNKALEENSTNPTQATTDLQSATSIASQVSSETAAVSSAGIKVHDLEAFESTGIVVTVVAVAGLLYITWDSIYCKWWTRTYRHYVVRLRKKS